MSLLNDRRSLLISNTDILPSIYRRVEYIESTGTQFIDTGYMPNRGTGIYLDFQVTEVYASFIFGTRAGLGATNTSYCTFNITSAGQFVTTFGNGTTATFFTADIKRHIFNRKARVAQLDGVQITNSNVTVVPVDSLLLLACNESNTYGRLPASARVYSCKIYNGDILVRDFIPCYRKVDQKAGLYDLVNNEFYINAGAGDFIVGGNV